MNKWIKHIVLLLSLHLIAGLVFSQTYYNKNIPLNGNETAFGVRVFGNSAHIIGFSNQPSGRRFSNYNKIRVSDGNVLSSGILYPHQTFVEEPGWSAQNMIKVGNKLFFPGQRIDSTSERNMVLTKIDTLGNLIWQKEFGDTTYWSAGVAIEYFKNHLYVAGYSEVNDPNGQGNLKKLDTAGNVVFDSSYGGGDFDVFYSIDKTSDYGLIMAGRTRSFGGGDNDPFIVKTDSNGNFQWQKVFDTPFNENPAHVKTLSDGNILAYYWHTDSIPAGIGSEWGRYVLVKLDNSGNILWKKFEDKAQRFYAVDDAIELSNGKIVISGSTSLFGYVFQFDPSGNLIRKSRFTKYNYFYINCCVEESYAIEPTPDGGFLAVGSVNPGSYPTGNQDVWGVKLDSLGCNLNASPYNLTVNVVNNNGDPYANLQWQDSAAGPGRSYLIERVGDDWSGEYEYFYPNLNYTDTTLKNGVSYTYRVIALRNSDSLMSCRSNDVITNPVSVKEVDKIPLKINLFPNPSTTGKVNLQTNKPLNATLELRSIDGKVLKRQQKLFHPGQNRLNMDGLSRGIYLVTIISEEETVTKKLVLE